MAGFGGGGDRFPGPASNNQPLEFGNRLGRSGAPSGGADDAPRPGLLPAPGPPGPQDPEERRQGPRSRGGPPRGPDRRAPSDNGNDYGGRRNDGSMGRRDRGRRDGSMNNVDNSMQMGGGPAPGQMMMPGPGLAPMQGPGLGQMQGQMQGQMPQQMQGQMPQQMQQQAKPTPGPWDLPQQPQQQPQQGVMGYGMQGMEMAGMYNMPAAGGVDPVMMMTPGQYNLLPAGVQQPLYPQLPGTWMPDGNFVPSKEVISCSECVLYPPNPNARPPMTRERPNGCRTVFIGGLPENITEEILRDVFMRCGEISSVRMSQKNFAHVRFELEVYVEYAIMLSGYRMRIRDETDPPNTGRLHCDYAQARDDMYEWECQQRAMEREMRHRQRQLEDMTRPPSPPPVTHYNHHEATQLMERIKDEATFGESVQLLVTWLERGDCNKRSAGNFYSMIQSTNSHVRRLMAERSQIEDELTKMKEQARLRQQQVIVQFGQIEHVFVAACQQKVWDHFSKAQRKNIELWKKQATEIKRVQIDELSGERAEEEMDLSDDDEPSKKRQRKQTGEAQMEEEADALRCQLEAYKNESEMTLFEHREQIEAKDKEMSIMRQTMQNVQQQLLTAKAHETTLERQLNQLRAQVARLKLRAEKEGKAAENGDTPAEGADADEQAEKEAEAAEGEAEAAEEAAPSGLLATPIDGQDARIIGLASAFLNVHPDGAGCDYIWSYLQQFPGYLSLSARDVETVLARYGRVFKEVVSGVGARMERKWTFTGYSPPQETE